MSVTGIPVDGMMRPLENWTTGDRARGLDPAASLAAQFAPGTGAPQLAESRDASSPPVALDVVGGAAVTGAGDIAATPPVSSTSPSGRNSAGADGEQDALRKLADRLTRQLAPSRSVRFNAEAPVGQVWLDVVDAETGAVIERIPPERVRELLEMGGPEPPHQGLSVDKRV